MTDSPPRAAARVFGRSAATYDTVIPFFARFGERLVEHAGVGPGDRVLDLACGLGASALPAASRVGSQGVVVGVDLAPEMVVGLRANASRAGGRVAALVADAAAPPLAPGRFDVVLCGFGVMFLERPGDALARWRALLAPRGRCALSVPTGAGPEWDFFGELMRELAPRAIRPLPPPPGSAPELSPLLRRAGFSDVEQVEETASFTFDGPEAWWAWVWTQGMRAALEALPQDAVADFKAAAFERLASRPAGDGIALHQRARFALGRRTA